MTALVRSSLIVVACIAIQACSSTPPASSAATGKPALPPAAAAAPSSPTPAPTQGAPDTAAATPHTIVLEDKTLTNEEIKDLFSRGYKPVSRNGQVYYCRREQQTGSRFASMTCKTADEMKQLEKDSKDMLSDAQKPGDCRSQSC